MQDAIRRNIQLTTILSYSDKDTFDAGKKLALKLIPGSIIALSGSLGSGKTVFTKGIAEGLEISCAITSPTFTLICEYQGKFPLFHMDLYRLNDVNEFEMAGGRDLLFSNGISVIEWAEKISDYFPNNTIKVNIEIEKNESRKIIIDNIDL